MVAEVPVVLEAHWEEKVVGPWAEEMAEEMGWRVVTKALEGQVVREGVVVRCDSSV